MTEAQRQEFIKEHYMGYNDPGLDFGLEEKASFINELKAHRQFKFKIRNNIPRGAKGIKKTICLHPAYFNRDKIIISNNEAFIKHNNCKEINAAGYKVDAVLTDGVCLKYIDRKGKTCTIVAESKALPIENFLCYCKYFDIRIPEITIESNNIKAFKRTMKIIYVNPFKIENNFQILNIADYFSPHQASHSKIIMPTPDFQLDNNTLLLIDIDPDIELLITYKIGVIYSTAHALRSKYEMAMNNIVKFVELKSNEKKQE